MRQSSASSFKKQTHSIFADSLILSHTNTSPALLPTAPPDPKKTQNNVVKLQLHLQPVKERKPRLGPRQQQRHRSPTPQQHPRTRHCPSVPADAGRQLGDPAQHPGQNPPRERESNRPEHTVKLNRSEHTRCRHQCRIPSPDSRSRCPALTRPCSNPQHARHNHQGHQRDSPTTR